MSDIIRARQEIGEIAEQLKNEGQADLARRLSGVIGLLRRRAPVRRMPAHSQKVTPEIKRKVLELAGTTNLHSAEIAAQLKINPGRVSEILQGDR